MTKAVENALPIPIKSSKTNSCPTYKVVEGTTFAVDAFRFGDIAGVTAYFLTHFHADHYIGLKRTFNRPLYVSAVTARLVQAFIPVDPQYVHVMELNRSYHIDGIEVVALDANQ